MLFYLFCMFDDYGGTNHRSPESAEKASSRHHIYETPFLKTIIDKFLLFQMMGEAKRGDPGGACEAYTTWQRGCPPGVRAGGVMALAYRGQPPFVYFYPP